MSPGLTMERVHVALKLRIMTGEFRPGARLDPARLARELHASATPVREALHRLTGERLVRSWPQEGFYVPILSEPGLRDLHHWSLALLLLATGEGRRKGSSPIDDPLATLSRGFTQGLDSESLSGRVAQIFSDLARWSSNLELQDAIAAVNDRLHRVRSIEAQILGDEGLELSDLASAILSRNAPLASQLVRRWHRRRLGLVPRVASVLRQESELPERTSY